jgi:hypothetical protein
MGVCLLELIRRAMNAELLELIQCPRLAEITRERRPRTLVDEVFEVITNPIRRTDTQITDLLSQSAYVATLQPGSKAEKTGIPLPPGMCDRHVVQLIAKIEGQFEVVVTQCVAYGDLWRRAEGSGPTPECRDHEVAEWTSRRRKSHVA